jgi:hypothetical protein
VEKLHEEELHNLYSLLSIIRVIKLRRMRWAGHVARMGDKRNAYRLVGKRRLGRPSHRWVVNNRMNLVEVGWGDVHCIDLAEDRDRWRASGSVKCWETVECPNNWRPLERVGQRVDFTGSRLGL